MKVAEFSESEIVILKRNRVGYTGDEKFFTINKILVDKLSEDKETRKLSVLLKNLLDDRNSINVEYKGTPVQTKFEKYRGWGCSIITMNLSVLFAYYIFSCEWMP